MLFTYNKMTLSLSGVIPIIAVLAVSPARATTYDYARLYNINFTEPRTMRIKEYSPTIRNGNPQKPNPPSTSRIKQLHPPHCRYINKKDYTCPASLGRVMP